MTENSNLLTSNELAEYLGVTAETVRLWRRTQNLPSIELTPGCIRFDRAEIDAWVRGRRNDSPLLPGPD